MRHLNVPDVKSGSEKTITPEDTWCLENCQWSDEEPATSNVRGPEGVSMEPEESGESEESDEDSDDSAATGEETY